MEWRILFLIHPHVFITQTPHCALTWTSLPEGSSPVRCLEASRKLPESSRQKA